MLKNTAAKEYELGEDGLARLQNDDNSPETRVQARCDGRGSRVELMLQNEGSTVNIALGS